jgi:putative ABC transport system permease protein
LKLGDLLGYSLGAMRERKLRAILTIAMVITGASLMTALNGLTTGMYLYLGAALGTLGGNVIVVTRALGQSSSLTTQITDETVSAIRQVDGVKMAVPYEEQEVTAQSGGSAVSVAAIAGNQAYLKEVLPSLAVAEGTLVAPEDIEGIVLGHSVAYPPGKPTPFAQLGSVVSISLTVVIEGRPLAVEQRFIVRGILGEMGMSGLLLVPVDWTVFISLPPPAVLRSWISSKYGAPVANALPPYNYLGVYVITASPETAEKVADAISGMYGKSLGVYTSKVLLKTTQDITSAYSILLGSISSVSLIVASVGIFAALYTSVMERTKEIGLLKAVGLKKRGILAVFLGEATLTGTMGGLLGDAAGVGLAYGMAIIQTRFIGLASDVSKGLVRATYVPPSFTAENFLLVFVFSVVVSMLAGAYPAWRASRLDPVVALRKE